MVRIFRHYVSPVKLTIALVDFGVVLASVFLAELIRYEMIGLQSFLESQSLIANLLVPCVVIPILLGVGGYEAEAISDMRVFFLRLMVGLLGSGLALSAFLYMLPMLPLWRSILLMTILLGGLLVFVTHWLFLKFTDRNFLSRRVVVLGAGASALELMQLSGRAADAGLTIVATIALPEDTVVVKDSVPIEEIGNLEQFIHMYQAELVIIAGDITKSLPVEALIACKLAGVEVQDRLAFFEQVRGYVDLASVKAEWIIFSDGFKGGSGWERALKRVSDIVVSLSALILFMPIILLAALAVKVTSKGPIFYRQERVGLNGACFNLLKFRSMKVDAEKDGVPEFAQKADPRVTPVGSFLRRTRIDELPQVMSVLKGDMSFVGPRPERPFFVSQLEKEIPFFKERHCLKPGITGWAQIQYPYGASFEDSKRKLEYDLYYIKNYSIFLDLLIILQTIRVILFPVGVR
ncbi:TIGR03013 family XrtA/PEP-CTERM system glycosyltransferase [Kordiimonas pumila]|uniref:TIGR03013 family XrtA/PEP-CTERM system glycosyltransferase n=1 Tax=Kordiimonas pumila TaxID=2161677 RepID=A0ABV7D2G4_9PROT|nr:TIGR03013 family XrtA/PEP-CTERM system glycosyltransferase [Kordiimonas pumila]